MNGSIKGRVLAYPGAQPAGGVPVRLAYRGGGAHGIDGLPATAMRRVATRGDGWFAVDGLQPGVWRIAAGDSPPLDVDVLAWAATDLTLEIRSGPTAPPSHPSSSSRPAPPTRPVSKQPEPMPVPSSFAHHVPQPDIWREPEDAPPSMPRPDVWPDPGNGADDDTPVHGGSDGDDGQAPDHNACGPRQLHSDRVGYSGGASGLGTGRGGDDDGSRGAADTGRVRGLVLRAGSFEPAEGATVMVVNGHGASPDLAPITDAGGRFALDGLAAGLWIFRAIAEDGATGENVVAVRPGSASEIVIEVGGDIGTSGWGDLRRVD